MKNKYVNLIVYKNLRGATLNLRGTVLAKQKINIRVLKNTVTGASG